MSIQTLTGIPQKFNAGDTVVFTENFADFPVGTWTAKLWLNLGTGTPVSITATTSGNDFLFTISAAASADISPGTYEYSFIVTSGSQQATPKTGIVSVLPNFATAQTPTYAQQQVSLLQTAIAALNTTTNSSVSFNGQSFSKANLGEYKSALVYWEARVLFEQDKLNTLRGNGNNHLVGVRFTPTGQSYPPYPYGNLRP